MNDVSREYFWGCVLNKDNPKVTWTFEEEEEDTDFLIHTLFLKQAVLGQAALKDERNLVTVETKNFDNEQIKHPVVSLTLGTNDMCNLDLSFGHENPVVFELVEGAGPVHLTAQQLVEMPDEGNISQDESCTETEEDEEELLEEKEPAKTKKRKASSSKGPTKSKEEDMEEDEEEDDEDEEEDEEEEEESEEESSPEKSSKKKKKAKETKANPRGKGKMTKASPVRGKAKKSRKV
ncbi:mitotic apparatus protein p62-like isoform X3 [Mizuhopecten yessoensis]|uniref:mitotic apparatus protein p62-like isoform X3 n=1 Tax=Mizuhopecten yessoensis TaxID=6573 RepID=UPI000B459698|nr:mitotic apparatus protein p62-like isoform X3 [Mizuhopecten yessoensis]